MFSSYEACGIEQIISQKEADCPGCARQDERKNQRKVEAEQAFVNVSSQFCPKRMKNAVARQRPPLSNALLWGRERKNRKHTVPYFKEVGLCFTLSEKQLVLISCLPACNTERRLF